MNLQNRSELRALARTALQDAGFAPDIPLAACQEAERVSGPHPQGPIEDLRGLLWSSIDNHDSLDLDQVEYVQPLAGDRLRVMVGIADVDEAVRNGGAIDQYAAFNTTSVYAAADVFPMLPERLSTDLTSIRAGQDRLAVVTSLEIDRDGKVTSTRSGRAWVRNHAKLDYKTVGDWLEGRGELPGWTSGVAGLEDQLRLQDEAAERLRALRQREGALDFETVEPTPVTEGGTVVGLEVQGKNRARYLIENFMIAANTALAEQLGAGSLPSIQRIVRTPARWDQIVELAEKLGTQLPAQPEATALSHFLEARKAADPGGFPELSLSVVKLIGPGEYVVIRPGEDHAGHFGLAVHEYTHSTAPNHRYVDLITQRLVKAVFAEAAPPDPEAELHEVAARCTERDRAAKKVERFMRKAVAAELLSSRIGQVWDAMVTGVTAGGVYVRISNPHAEGRLTGGEHGLKVGRRLRVRLASVRPEKAFIDFDRVG